MSGDKNSNLNIEFSKMDNSIEQLVLSISAWSKKSNHRKSEPKEKPKRVVKKLNVELIRQVLQETKELQHKKNSEKNKQN